MILCQFSNLVLSTFLNVKYLDCVPKNQYLKVQPAENLIFLAHDIKGEHQLVLFHFLNHTWVKFE